ncbi:hypothetical protein GCM10022223_62420 [Kineosporia mesophila]|uniref:Methyltransferase n=1 Tax=Kineosporia mesophila TaxID=566012 RepID=A0ABP7ALF6_9ACTN|nr:hypothetical protein [Kineosporia mesophila]MCD5354507.1 hypothetical protein [Kineosporia mesophila]
MRTKTLTSPRTVTTLEKLYTPAEEARKKPRSPARRQDIAAMSPAERADAPADAYMPISPEGGRLLYALTRAARPTTVVEFGTSYGLSTIHLAAAVADRCCT